MDIVQIGDPILRQVAEPWTDPNHGRRKKLVREMTRTMQDAPGVGLAAPQIGMSVAMFVYDDIDGHRGAVFNPVITPDENSGKIVMGSKEGCLSCVGENWLPVPRWKTVRLVGEGVDGEVVDIVAHDLLARIFQHEVDHLKGVLYVDYMGEAMAWRRRSA